MFLLNNPRIHKFLKLNKKIIREVSYTVYMTFHHRTGLNVKQIYIFLLKGNTQSNHPVSCIHHHQSVTKSIHKNTAMNGGKYS